MDRPAYWATYSLLALGFAAAATWAYVSGGKSRLWWTWAAAVVVLGTLALTDWAREPGGVLPAWVNLLTYMAAVTISTAGSAWFVQATQGRHGSAALRAGGVLGATVLCLALVAGVLVLSLWVFYRA
jgi:hypothetical protein